MRPSIANVTEDLLKVKNGANTAAFCELLCVICYVLDTKNLGIKLEPSGNANEPWDIACFSDSDYAWDPVDYAWDPVSRRNISGFILYVLGVPVS